MLRNAYASESIPSVVTNCVLSLKYEFSHCNALQCTSYCIVFKLFKENCMLQSLPCRILANIKEKGGEPMGKNGEIANPKMLSPFFPIFPHLSKPF